jgi:cell shape-determining protein MreC
MLQAMEESLGENTQRYERRIAELRVEITVLRNENNQLREALNSRQEGSTEVIEGEVVSEEG